MQADSAEYRENGIDKSFSTQYTRPVSFRNPSHEFLHFFFKNIFKTTPKFYK